MRAKTHMNKARNKKPIYEVLNVDSIGVEVRMQVIPIIETATRKIAIDHAAFEPLTVFFVLAKA